MNRYVISAIGATICTISEAFIIHLVQVFFPDTFNNMMGRFMSMIPLNAFDATINMLILIAISLIIWMAGFYFVFKERN